MQTLNTSERVKSAQRRQNSCIAEVNRIEALHSRDHYVILIYVCHVGIQLRVGQWDCLYVFRLISHKIYLVNFEHFPDSARPGHFYRSAQAR